MPNKHIAAAVLPIVVIGLINNARNVETQLSSVAGRRRVVAPKIGDSVVHDFDDSAAEDSEEVEDCLRARRDSVPPSSHRKLPKPYVNLGFPKMGTSSLHEFFKCGGLASTHLVCGFRSGGYGKCASCIRESAEAGLPPLDRCDEADVYAQMDNGGYFPQIELLEEFVNRYPDATFFLTFRNMSRWYHSITHWPPRPKGPHMDERWKRFNITGSPPAEGPSNQREFGDWYCNHVKRVRRLVEQYPSHTLVEVDIEDPETGQRMEDMFGVDKSCWGQTNVNLNIHSDVNRSEVDVSRHFKKKAFQNIEGGDGDGDESRPEVTDVDADESQPEVTDEDGISDDNEENESDNSDEEDVDGDTAAVSFDDEDEDQSTDANNGDIDNRTCLRARHDSVPPSLYRNIPKPYINLGFPKMGTSSLHAYFECGGLKSTHFRCGKGSDKCAVCTKNSVEAGLPPLAKCGKADMYAQLDNGAYFPQIELLEEFVVGHPNATFFLTFRSMERWYHSIRHWPPRKRGPHMDERWKRFNITGSPPFEGPSNLREFSDWYCSHVERVRDLVARHPSHTLVEVDIEDPGTARRMEDMFGVDKGCWGHANVNANIHPDLLGKSDVRVNRRQVGMLQTGEPAAEKQKNGGRRRKHGKQLAVRTPE